MKKWETIEKQHKYTSTIFKHEVVKRRSPDSGVEGVFDVVHCLNWVNIIPLTPNNEVVFVKQYRHGVDEVTLEIPGGAVNRGEDFEKAAMRELEEETGYRSQQWTSLGHVDPNPAFMSNKCHIFLAKNVSLEAEMDLDPLEEIELELIPLEDVPALIKEGKVTHSLVVAGFYLLERELQS